MRPALLAVGACAATLAGVLTAGPALGAGAGASADSRPPSQTIFASSRQRAGSLYLLITIHERGQLKVTAKAGSYRYSSFTKSAPAHIPNQVRLKLTGGKLRSARKAIRSGRRLTAVVKSRGTDAAGNSRTYTKRIRLRA
jgi:hypothetical protein